MLGPLACLILGIVSILFFILYLRLHAFLALISSALIVAFASDRIPIDQAMVVVTGGFGRMMAGIGILLIFAAIIGKCLMDSGAADRIVRSFIRLFGEGREHYSLMSSSFLLAIPVFFDTVFYLLAPLARAVYARRKRDYVLLICTAAAGGAVTHALIPPTPGPILVSEQLQVPIGMTMLVGFISSIVPVFVGGLWYSHWINNRMTITPKDIMGTSQAELEAMALKPDSELPSLTLSLLPILVPVFLIALTTVADLTMKPEEGQQATLYYTWIKIMGDKNSSFFIGAVLAVLLLFQQKRMDKQSTFKLLEPAIVSGAVIAFITCAGGAFGAVLASAEVGEVIADTARTFNIPILVLAFLTAVLIRIAQGSATVAMTTTAGIFTFVVGMDLPYHPAYLVAIIGFGATTTSWMNDSGFWIVGQMSGFSEKETLKTWTVLLTILAWVGFAWVLLLANVLPLKG